MWTAIKAFVGTTFNRLRGIGIPKRAMWLILLGVACGYFIEPPPHIPTEWYWDLGFSALLGGIFAAGWTLGWGSYIDLGRNDKGWMDETESMDWLVGHEQEGWDFAERWRRDVLGLAGRGLLITLPVGILLLDPIFALCGLAMPLWYEIGHRIPSKIKYLNQGPELGETMFGAWVFIWI